MRKKKRKSDLSKKLYLKNKIKTPKVSLKINGEKSFINLKYKNCNSDVLMSLS